MFFICKVFKVKYYRLLIFKKWNFLFCNVNFFVYFMRVEKYPKLIYENIEFNFYNNNLLSLISIILLILHAKYTKIGGEKFYIRENNF